MKNNVFKKMTLCGHLTSGKHHARSRRNDNQIRKKRTRRLLKEQVTSTIREQHS